MNIDMTKVANIILYMLHKQVTSVNDKKVLIMLFLMEHNHLNFCNKKIINEVFIKEARQPRAVVLSELFEIILSEDDLEEDDERVYFIQELMDFLELDIVEKSSHKELHFSKYEEDFDESLFTADEMKTIHKVVNDFKNTSPRNIANDCFNIELVRKTPIGEIIL